MFTQTGTRLPIVGVMGSGTASHTERAEEIGQWLAHEQVHLLTGGGGGVMSAVSKAFAAVPHRTGLVIGIIPSATADPLVGPKAGYPNAWVEIPIFTHLPLSGERGTDSLSRNHINILSSDVLIALPGGPGTASEVALARRYGRPLIAYLNQRDEILGLPAGVLIEGDLQKVQTFVRSTLTAFHSAESHTAAWKGPAR
jgi:uncharacterized protein (TIGR00725 family)